MLDNVNQIITLNLLENPDHPVNARDLHGFLEVQTPFSMWIQRRIEEYGFTQDIDFVVFNNFVNDATAFGGKRKVIDYHITLDIAKELSMVERNEKGKEARRYFIECERKLRKQQTPQPRQLPYTPEERANIAFKSLYEIAKIAEVPKSFALQECSQMASRASGCDITRLVTQGKDMNNVPDKDVMLEPTELGKHYGLSGKAMNQKLKELGLQYHDNEGWQPTEIGKPICKRHAWAVKNKGGYNLKWNWQAIDNMINR